MELRHPTPNHGISYSFVFDLVGIRRITEVKLCQTVSERIRVTASLTGESTDFREVWRRTKFRKSSSPSECWPDWQSQGCLVTRSGGQAVVGWSLAEPCLAALSRGEGQLGQPQPSLFSSNFSTMFVMFFYYVCATSFTSSFSVSISCCVGSCSFPLRESWQGTCPSPCLILSLTFPPTTLFSHFLAYTGMEISGLLSFASLIFTWTSNFQLPFTTHNYFFGYILLPSQT